jgi:hypothetical protein
MFNIILGVIIGLFIGIPTGIVYEDAHNIYDKKNKGTK